MARRKGDITRVPAERMAQIPWDLSHKRSAVLPNGLTPKQETFAQLVAEGFSKAAAYRAAYPRGAQTDAHIYVNATQESKKSKVANRINELRQNILAENNAQSTTRAARVALALETLMREARTESARVRAAELLGKSVGLFVDRTELSGKDGTTIADLEAKLADMLGHEGRKK